MKSLRRTAMVVASDVTFTVHADGSVTPVSMYDYPTVVHITKKDITTGDELPGAYLELYDKDHNLIDAWGIDKRSTRH